VESAQRAANMAHAQGLALTTVAVQAERQGYNAENY